MNLFAFSARRAKRPLWQAVALLALAQAPQLALAQTDAGRPNYTAGDWALSPEWCIDTQDGPYGSPNFSDSSLGKNHSPRSAKWTRIFGNEFWHMHHFCRALYAERKLMMTVGEAKRISAAAIVLNEYRYLLAKCTPANPLLPEIYLRTGDIQLKMGDSVSAMESYENARTLKPDYWPAYTRWIDELIKLGMYGKARELVDQGLEHMPDEPNLLQRRETLDRKH